MYQLPDLTLEAILKEWHPQEYDPPNTDIREWNLAMESLCDTYGIPDTQRQQCATKFIKDELRTELEKVFADARARFGPIHWAQFTNFMAVLDRQLQEAWKKLPFYKKHPKLTWGNFGITGATALTPPAVVDALKAVGLTPAEVATSIGAAIFRSTIYGNVAEHLFYLLQSAGTTAVLSSVGKTISGTAATGAKIATMDTGSVDASEILSNSIDGSPPPCHQAVPQEYILTPQTIQVIVQSWDIPVYDPPLINVAGWLGRVDELCEAYGVPVMQRVLCAMHHMGADCRGAAHAAGCDDMSWDQFTIWLLRWDDAKRKSKNGNSSSFSSGKWFAGLCTRGRVAEPLMKKSKL